MATTKTGEAKALRKDLATATAERDRALAAEGYAFVALNYALGCLGIAPLTEIADDDAFRAVLAAIDGAMDAREQRTR